MKLKIKPSNAIQHNSQTLDSRLIELNKQLEQADDDIEESKLKTQICVTEKMKPPIERQELNKNTVSKITPKKPVFKI